ncbi:GNAT family N-acetyltransferase [Natronosalvus halobius]|uniref:GNAT family N-acetyltransferase n=1 Tax=Natronosalvus halobius TaxID=2953746 RepID=UPI00209E2828|nr:GNAT family N-acetyltransferase [Natronosalvus halobius]USZ70604.1 GNAT family N-acetyltransferase [Natronosalvus halobius]
MTHTRSPNLSGYAIDWFREHDRESFLDLYAAVFGRQRTDEWFRWKYEANPYVDHVPIAVARRQPSGTVVGCRAYFPLEVSVDDETYLAFQPCDTMVHPEHRRRGLFTAMNRWGLERYDNDGPAFFFNFPNAQAKPGNERLGWRPVGTVPMYYRVQNPVAVLARWLRAVGSTVDARVPITADSAGTNAGLESTDQSTTGETTRPADAFARALTSAVTTGHRLGDRLLVRRSLRDADVDVNVERYDLAPVGTLETLARRSRLDGIRVRRSSTFYRWRLDNPLHEYVTVLARRTDTGLPIAAIIVSPQDDHVRLVDALPRGVDANDPAAAALEHLFLAVLEAYRKKPFLTAFGDILPDPLRYRFLPDTQVPLEPILRPTTRTLYARGLDDDVGRRLASSTVDDWHLSRLDLDTT